MVKGKKRVFVRKADDDEELYLTKENEKVMESLRKSALRKTNNNKKKPLEDEEVSIDSEIEEAAESDKEIETGNIAELNNYNGLINKKVEMEEKLEDLRLDLPFDESLVVFSKKLATVEVPDFEDDLKRELAFYSQALECVKVARSKVNFNPTKLNVRPGDFFAEMVKSDKHMGRIKQNLLFEKQKMEAFEKRRQNQEFRKVAKKVQADRVQEKTGRKRKAKEAAEEFRAKNINNAGGSNKMSRQSRNSKFGFGGRKGMKRNTKQSVNNFTDAEYMQSRKKTFGQGNYDPKKKNAGKGRAPAKRLGKSRRQKR